MSESLPSSCCVTCETAADTDSNQSGINGTETGAERTISSVSMEKDLSPRKPVLLTVEAINIGQAGDECGDGFKTVLDWIDRVKFSRIKKHLHRDFSDGVMMAELISCYLPKVIERHNYAPANSSRAKRNNWRLLNRKVFLKMDFQASDPLIELIVAAKPGAIEVVLKTVYEKILNIIETKARLAAEQEAAEKLCKHKGEGDVGSCTFRQITCQLFGSQNDYVMYEGIKFLNWSHVEEKCRKLEGAEQEVQQLRCKIRRLETLVSLKDDRLIELSAELQRALQLQHQKTNTTTTGSASSSRRRK